VLIFFVAARVGHFKVESVQKKEKIWLTEMEGFAEKKFRELFHFREQVILFWFRVVKQQRKQT